MTSEGLNPILLQYRALEVQEKMAESENKVFIPYEFKPSRCIEHHLQITVDIKIKTCNYTHQYKQNGSNKQ